MREKPLCLIVETINRCKIDEVVCLMGGLKAQTRDVKINGVVGDFGVPGTNENGVFMLKVYVHNMYFHESVSLSKRIRVVGFQVCM